MEETCFFLNCLGSLILPCISSSHQYPIPSPAFHPSPRVSNVSLFLYLRARSPPHFYLSSFIFLSCFVSREGRRRMTKTIGVCMGNSLMLLQHHRSHRWNSTRVFKLHGSYLSVFLDYGLHEGQGSCFFCSCWVPGHKVLLLH